MNNFLTRQVTRNLVRTHPFPLFSSIRFNSLKVNDTTIEKKKSEKDLKDDLNNNKDTGLIKNDVIDTDLIKKQSNELIKPLEKNLKEPKEPKKTIWEKVKHEATHYWDGTKLLGYEIKISTKLMVKLIAGYGLTRRETNQLQRTFVDVGKLVPFALFILIPFAELLLPVALKIFPNLLPSTYESKQDKLKKREKLFKTRNSASDFIKKSLEESGGLKLSKKITDNEREAFVSFFDIISMGNTPSHSHITKVARLFKNDQVLDNLSRSQLTSMCKYMGLKPFGTDNIVRYQIRHRLLNIIKDDKVIDYEGVDTLSTQELHLACSQRGISTTNTSPGRLRDDLNMWLDLRLRQKIPSTLLILANSYSYGDHSDIETYYDALLAVLSSIPDEVYNVAKGQLSDDSRLKLSILKEQEDLINEENEREKDIVTKVKDDLNIDDLEETASDGVKIEEDSKDDLKQESKDETKSEKPKETELK